ncbi:MAG TPA: neutral/alkaline ceramidase [Candidatus Corynebacterium gallistercoris]|uniref:Neutral ceramidase n=1 Tax=Candidatus Corynebacterium gallistercoris TaxID=2838530 RepID=A0A9D1RZ23_9CORY|nr:neutral/alkaline ceramidase [Candidatus Corynebacterium gallistercoris]
MTRRTFLAASAAASSTVLWTSAGMPAGASPTNNTTSAPMNVGRGMADITGEPWGAGMFGYAVGEQTTVGIQRRQYARAFIFQDGAHPDNTLVHVTLDVGLMFQSIHLEVLRRLQQRLGGRYGEHNVLLHATHTHVAPGGTSQHLMVDLTHGGFRPKTFEATVEGTVQAILRAHDDLQPSEVTITHTTVTDAGRNRSRQSFDRNPQEDKDHLPGGVDPRSVTLHVHRGGEEVGLINWYSIHPTTFGPDYRHISGDNKGYAAWRMEHDRGVNHRNPATAGYVAAFANATPGDITPNHGLTPGSGPGKDEQDSARILGERMMAAASQPNNEQPTTTSTIDGRYAWIDCATLTASPTHTPDGQTHRLGPAILGAAFAASSQEDGGGVPELGLNEGERGGNPIIGAIGNVVVPPDVLAIHAPKEVLLPMGYIPGMIQRVHPFHINRIGNLVLVSLGFEPTVTSGLRLRRTVAEAMDVPLDHVIVQGYTNSYGHYITTPEEYEAQNYEGGATIFGKYQLPAFQDQFQRLATALHNGAPISPGAPAGDLTGLIPTAPGGNTWVDIPPPARRFGDVLAAPGSIATGENVAIQFVGANPNNNLRHGEGYITIANQGGEVVADDSSETTLITFSNHFGTTTTTVHWDTSGMPPGDYTVRLRGDSRALFGNTSPFEGRAVVQVRG